MNCSIWKLFVVSFLKFSDLIKGDNPHIFPPGGNVISRGDGASVSSVGSSCSTPPGGDDQYYDSHDHHKDHMGSPVTRRRSATGTPKSLSDGLVSPV